MEPTRFDRLAKGLVHVRSRRDLLRVLATGCGLGVATHLSRRLHAEAAACAGRGKPCTNNEDCCGELRCDGVVCGAPKPEVRVPCVNPNGSRSGTACTVNGECCSGCCVLGATDSGAARGTCAPTAIGAASATEAGACVNENGAPNDTACEANSECCSNCCVHTVGGGSTTGTCGEANPPFTECSKAP
jgi:hypothetical protein